MALLGKSMVAPEDQDPFDKFLAFATKFLKEAKQDQQAFLISGKDLGPAEEFPETSVTAKNVQKYPVGENI